MALQPCRECGRMVSTEASTCPQCGVPDPTQSPLPALDSDSNMARGEEVVYRAHLHRIIYFWPVVLTLLSLALVLFLPGEIVLVSFVGLALALIAWIRSFIIANSMEFVITNRRITTRIGILNKNSQETLLEKVETVGVHQDLLGRILGYGTVTVVGTGGSHDEFTQISEPMKLRRTLHDQIDSRKAPAR